MKKPSLLLIGGGSRGINQAASLLAMHDLKIQYGEVRTSSVGTLNGLVYHAGHVDQMVDNWLNIRTKDLISKGWLDLPFSYKRRWLHGSSRLREYIEKNTDFPSLLANPADFWVNATDLTNGRSYSREVKSFTKKQDFVTLAYASASPPVYFPTVPFENMELCDSGVTNNYSITDAINAGYETLIAVFPAKPEKSRPATNIFGVLTQVLGLAMNSDLERETKAIVKINRLIDRIHSVVDDKKCSILLEDMPQKIKLILIYPETEPTFDFLDFDFKGIDREKLMLEGYQRAKSILEAEWH